MFRRGSLVYVMLGFDCCFCQWGGDSLVFRAPSPLGPWTPQQAGAHERSGADVPPANWSNEVNYCGDGTQPPTHVADMTINPCSQV